MSAPDDTARSQIPVPSIPPETGAEAYLDYVNQKASLSAEKYIEQHGESRWKAYEAGREFSTTALKLLVILNAGAILALLTFVGTLYGRDKLDPKSIALFTRALQPTFYLFMAGIAGSLLAAVAGYLNWGRYAESFLNPAELYEWMHGKQIKRDHDPWIRRTMLFGVSAALASLTCFLVGACWALRAFKHLG
jgi:hypothetical protein